MGESFKLRGIKAGGDDIAPGALDFQTNEDPVIPYPNPTLDYTQEKVRRNGDFIFLWCRTDFWLNIQSPVSVMEMFGFCACQPNYRRVTMQSSIPRASGKSMLYQSLQSKYW